MKGCCQNERHHYPVHRPRRFTETAGSGPAVAVQIVGDQDADGRVTSASICVAAEFLLMPDEAEAFAADLIGGSPRISGCGFAV
jgi:hypothetical protein